MVFFPSLLVAIFMILELVAIVVLATPFDSHASRDINDMSSKIIQMTSGDSNRIGNITDVSSSGSQQHENNTSLAISPAPSERIMTNSSLSSPLVLNNTCVAYDSVNRTVNICGGSADLSTIDQVINSSDILNNTSYKNWILNANVSVEDGATLFINSTDTDWLRINSTAGRTHSIVVYGNLIIDRTKISSWNSITNTETALSDSANITTPRGYLLMHWGGTGQMNITNSNISNLGFKGVKDTWGIAYYSGSGSTLLNNNISSNFRGAYLTTNASNIVIANNTIQNSSQHGLNLFKAKDAKILDNKISSNKEHGIFCTRECENVLIKSNQILDSGRNGIVLNQDTTNSTIKQNVVKDNNRSGIAIWNSSRNMVDGNLMQQNGLGITITQNSSYNTVSGNSIAYSVSDGILLDTNSTNNRIEKNEMNRSGRSGVYMKYAIDNTFLKNNITENLENGMVLLNSTKNVLVSNNVSANVPYNYYLRTNSTFNIIRDTFLENTSLRFFDNSSNIVLENTDNRITDNNKKDPIHAYFTNVTSLLEPVTKNVLVNTLDMFAIPSTENVEISSISKGFDTNQKHKKWFEKRSLPFSMADDKKASTRYIIGSFPPDTQIVIRANSSFWNAYTSNSSGYIDFVYDGYGEGVQPAGVEARAGEKAGAEPQPYIITVFEAEANNSPTIATIILFAILIAGSTAFILIRRYLKKQKMR